MKYFILLALAFYWPNSTTAQVENYSDNERGIIIHEFQSKIFSRLEEIMMDTIKSNFDCSEIDLVLVSLKDYDNCFYFRLSPIRGYIFTMFGKEDYRGIEEYGVKLEGSNITYLFKEEEIDLLKQIGHLRQLKKLPFLPFVKELNNKCLNEESKGYSEINLAIIVNYW
jgi:hypothetical protein